MRIKLAYLTCCSILLAAVTPARADVFTDIGFAGTGASFSRSSPTNINPPSPANNGGIVASYSGFNFANYGQLYFGLKSIDMGQLGSGASGLFNLTTLGPFGTSSEQWSGTFSINTLNGVVETATGVFTATLSSGTWVDPTLIPLGPGAPLAVAQVTGDFTVTETFTVNGMAYNDWYNQFNNLGRTSHTDSSGDFWASAPAAAVPGPIVGAGLPGLVAAFGGLLAWRRRRLAAG